MKKTAVTILSFAFLTACQLGGGKKTNTNMEISDQSFLTPSPVNISQTMESLEQCYLDESCKNELNLKLDQWMVEKGIVADTSESESEHLSKFVTKQAEKGDSILLSSNYMSNELVKGAINEWLTWKRPQLINTWKYYQYMKKDILPEFDKYKISESFVVAIMSQESGGKVHSSSRAGAGGLFQLMPATAKRMGISGKDGAYDARFNPARAAQAAAKYLDEQLKLYDNDKAKVLAAYNSGENRFARISRYHKDKSLWDKNFYYELPRETRRYVPTVLAAMLILQNPEKFNVVLPQSDSAIMTVSLPQETSLSELSVCLGQEQREDGWFRVLRNLNYGIQADKSIKANTDILIPQVLSDTFEVNCRNESLMQLAKSFHDSDFKVHQGFFSYRVKRGDSLNKIARKFRCTSKQEIAHINKLKAPKYLIRAGKNLKIPQC